jgi:Flp pilus assembly protein TadD
MRNVFGKAPSGRAIRLAGTATVLVVAIGLAGCSGFGGTELGEAGGSQLTQTADTTQAPPAKDELASATEYWGKEHAKNPRDPKAALAYAKNLKAMGRKKEAYAVLQQAHKMNPKDREQLSEYGRLALEFDQVSTAKALLERADDPANPDWRVLNARGTVLAKEGKHKEATVFFERALALAPSQPSVLNNLALAHAMAGEAQKAEDMLRQASASGDADPRVNQNLALVLSLQGKYGEAKRVPNQNLPPEAVQANVDYVKSVVQVAAKPESVPASSAVATASTKPWTMTTSAAKAD